MSGLNLSDTHCHLNLSHFDVDRDDVILSATEVGVKRILIPAIDLKTSEEIARSIRNHQHLFGAIGVHPNDANTWDNETRQKLVQLVEKDRQVTNKIVAIGEIGLDHYWKDVPQNVQEHVLRRQLELAKEVDLPIIVHMRESKDEVNGSCSQAIVPMITEWVAELNKINSPLVSNPGVFHSFSGDPATLDKILALNFYVGVTGPITYKSSEYKREVVKSIPLDRLLIETDSPFLAPVPYRGKRNEPANVKLILEKIAEILEVDPQMIAEITNDNANRLFSWEVNF